MGYKLKRAIELAEAQFHTGFEEVDENGLQVLYVDEDKVNYLEDTDIPESIRKVTTVRKGKKVVRFATNKPGYKIKFVNGRPTEVRLSSRELSNRKKASKKYRKKK